MPPRIASHCLTLPRIARGDVSTPVDAAAAANSARPNRRFAFPRFPPQRALLLEAPRHSRAIILQFKWGEANV